MLIIWLTPGADEDLPDDPDLQICEFLAQNMTYCHELFRSLALPGHEPISDIFYMNTTVTFDVADLTVQSFEFKGAHASIFCTAVQLIFAIFGKITTGTATPLGKAS